MPGWFPCSSDGWQTIAEVLPQPWRYEWCLDDLAWWADRERFTGGRVKRPGRPALARRWGVSDRLARKALKDPAWRSRQKTGVQPVSSERPAGVQPVSSERPAPATANADNGPQMSSERPAGVQPVSSRCPADVLTRSITPTPTPAPAPEKKDPVSTPIQQVWDHYRAHRPAVPKAPPRDQRKYFADRLKLDKATTADLCLVCDWVFESADGTAAFLREGGHIGPSTWAKAKGWSDRLTAAREWDERGRTTTAPTAQADPWGGNPWLNPNL